jgi:hypothetical protein
MTGRHGSNASIQGPFVLTEVAIFTIRYDFLHYDFVLCGSNVKSLKNLTDQLENEGFILLEEE